MKEVGEYIEPIVAEQEFGMFLKQARMRQKVTLAQLAEGLMEESNLARIEKGQRPIEKIMRDRLLGRLGMSVDQYETKLTGEEYLDWTEQRAICKAITDIEENILLCREDTKKERIKKASILIQEYETKTGEADLIRKQFCLIMKAEIKRLTTNEKQEIGLLYEKAIKLSFPNIESINIQKMLLSVQEMNLLLEYTYYNRRNMLAKLIEIFLSYIEERHCDIYYQLKIYPKMIFYYVDNEIKENKTDNLEVMFQLLKKCNIALNILQKKGKTYYLYENLFLKERLLNTIYDIFVKQKDYNKAKIILKLSKENLKLKNTYESICNEYRINKYMTNIVYMYEQRRVICIGDAIRKRRKMLGITQQQLCDGICSVKSLRRIEKQQSQMQVAALTPMLEKLGLSSQLQRTDIITNNPRVVQLEQKFEHYYNIADLERSKKIIKMLEKMIATQIPCNNQYLIMAEALIDYKKNDISGEEYVGRLKKALSCTISNFDSVFFKEELYFTSIELLCISKIMVLQQSKEEKMRYINLLRRYFVIKEREGLLSEEIIIYEVVMKMVASELGNIGEFEQATQIEKKIICESLKQHRLFFVDDSLYGIWWNEKEQTKIENVNEKQIQKLRMCVTLSRFLKKTEDEKFYSEKLAKIR